MSVPTDRRYTKDHEWVLVQGGTAIVGITEFAQSELGDLVFVDLPAIGKEVTAHAAVCVVESTKAASDVYAPINGKVSEVNATLKDQPELVNSDPYGAGWLVKLNAFSEKEVAALMSPEEYNAHIGK